MGEAVGDEGGQGEVGVGRLLVEHLQLDLCPLLQVRVVGHADDRAGVGRIGKWVPPEQAGGAPWDAAANRYVLGLVAYRLIAGEHPFAGGGLRGAFAGLEYAEAFRALRLTVGGSQ